MENSLSLAKLRAPTTNLRFAMVVPVAIQFDAVLAAARDTALALSSQPGWNVSLFTYRCDFPDLRAHIVDCVSDMLIHPEFLAADLIVYSFAIYSGLFDAIAIGNGRAKQIVHFHNITPRNFVPQDMQPVVDRSFRQLHQFEW